jgi:hypothetical protein
MALGSAYGLHHLCEHRTGKRQVRIRIETGRNLVHLLTPGPEAASADSMRSAAENAMKGVAVAIGQTRQRYTAQDLGSGWRFDADSDSRKAPIFDVKGDTAMAAVRQPGVRGPVRGHDSAPAKSASTETKAVTPARQSSGSARSAGE